MALRLDDHEVHIERLGGCTPHGPDDHRAQRDVGHETAIHDIDMNPIGARQIDRAHLFGQTAEIRRQDGRRDNDRPTAHRSPPRMKRSTAMAFGRAGG